MTPPLLYISWLLLLAETTFQSSLFVTASDSGALTFQVRAFSIEMSVNIVFRNRYFPQLTKMLSEEEGALKPSLFPIM